MTLVAAGAFGFLTLIQLFVSAWAIGRAKLLSTLFSPTILAVSKARCFSSNYLCNIVVPGNEKKHSTLWTVRFIVRRQGQGALAVGHILGKREKADTGRFLLRSAGGCWATRQGSDLASKRADYKTSTFADQLGMNIGLACARLDSYRPLQPPRKSRGCSPRLFRLI